MGWRWGPACCPCCWCRVALQRVPWWLWLWLCCLLACLLPTRCAGRQSAAVRGANRAAGDAPSCAAARKTCMVQRRSSKCIDAFSIWRTSSTCVYRELQADANIAAIRGRNIDAEERRRAKAEKEEYDRCNPQLQLCCCSMLLACASASASFLFDGAAAGRWQFCSGQRRRWSTSLKRCAVHRSSAQPHTSNLKLTPNPQPQTPLCCM